MAGNTKKSNKPIIAICYDFDKTLCTKDMQEYSLIPKLGFEAKAFWAESDKLAKEHKMDKILSYMKLILDKARDTGIRISEADFKELGKSVELFEGVSEWFDMINKYGESLNVEIQHYIISAGLKDIIEGTSIHHHFKAIYASSFMYSKYGEPLWPSQVVNYTTKTQYLFRINKNSLDLSDEESVNKYLAQEERLIPFHHFIYIGDSDTDIPAMRVVKKQNGFSIGVYNPEKKNISTVNELIMQDRINFYAPANYKEGQQLDMIVRNIIRTIKNNHSTKTEERKLNEMSELQIQVAVDYMEIEDVYHEIKKVIQEEVVDQKALKELKSIMKFFIDHFMETYNTDEIASHINIRDYIDNINALVNETK